MLPEGWLVKPLKEITKIYDGTHQTPTYVEKGIPFYSVEHLTSGNFNETKYIAEDIFEKENQRVALEKNDILMTRIGDIGTAKLINWDVRASFYVSLALIKQNKSFDSAYMENFINSFIFQTELWKRTIHVAFPKKINLGEIGNCEVTLPPLPEQKKIAQILSTWDNAISATERLLENSQLRKKALMQQLLTGKKRLPGFEGEWSTVKLGDLGDTYGGLTGKTKEDFGSGEPYITYMSVFADGAIIPDKFDYVKLKEGEKQHSVEYGDILFTTSSETPEEVGMASVMLERLPFKVYLNSFCFGFRLSSLDVLIPEYAKYYMRSEGIRRAIANLAQGATRYNLSKKQLLKISLHLPSISEQQTIANILTTADQEIDALQKRLGHLKLEKKALMQQLLTGKRRVQVDDAA